MIKPRAIRWQAAVVLASVAASVLAAHLLRHSAGYHERAGDGTSKATVCRAVVRGPSDAGGDGGKTSFAIISGPYRGREVRRARAGACGELERDGGTVGGRYVVAVERSGGEWVAGRVVRERDRYLLGLTAALVALLAITTGWMGLATVGSVAWAWGLLVGLVLPAVLAGARAGMLCVAVAPAIAAPTLLAIGGVNRKTASAIAGTLCGMLAGGLIAAGFVDAMALTGLEVEFGPHAHLDNALWFARPLHHVRFASLLMAGLLLAGLGAVMDVSMAVASTVAQVHRAAPTASRWALFRSGLAAGRDIFGVMVFTLVAVFAGSQLASLVPLAPTGWADRWLTLTNYEEIACELARAAAAAGGMALCVPAAAAVAALLHGKRAKAEAERVPRVSIRPRLPLRPLLAVLACLAVAGLADELTLRSYCGGPGRTAHETSGRVVAFDRPAVEPSARSNDPHDRTFFRSQPVVLQPYFGPHAGHLLPARLILGPNPSHHLLLRPDSAVHLSVDGDAGATDVKLYKPPLRYRWGLVAMLVTAVMLVAAGGRAGVRVLLVMAGAAAVMLGVLLPLLARGYPPLPVAAGCCAGMLVAVFAITGSVGRKAFAAMLGSAVGIALAAGLLLFSNWWLDITGTQSVPAHLLEWLGDKLHVAYDHAGLLAASLLVALVGLMMDTAVTVAAGVAQVCAARADVSRREAAAAGLSISRDVVGTMILTLLFAFVGLRLPAFLLPSALGLSPAELINSEAGASQILQALVGSIALASTGPAAAIAAALLMAGRAPQATRPNRASLWRPARAIVAVLAIVGIAAGGGAWWTLRQKRLSQAVLPPLPGEVDALIADAAHARRQREFGHALLALWKARDRGPHDPRTRVELAYTYMGRGWAMHAEREIQGALDAGADDTMAHYVAGVVYAWTGKLDKAERHLRRAIVLDPGNAPARDAVKRLFGP